ncbi:HAD family hydrolase [Acutalibacter sp. 1XD8-33]|uniref:HAD family hydrolase n=1 Tax=Acutalibacter sp. 1XD8-33 TaxID=2320081 RepID=UPI000EA2BA12|nr:HAD family hydrolase [Acutalibacter sp. 1XD8-33]RKJ39971.1 HAD family hydrolase [Acutalibacter sp. 1XD8-33]
MEHKSYRACIFDLDGTLADTLHSIAHFGNRTLEAFGLPSIDIMEYRLLVGNGADLLMRRMLKRVGADLPEEEIRRFRAEYDRRYAADPLDLVGAYPGVPEGLVRQHDRGVRMAVLSNKPDDMTRAIVAGLYPGIFDAVHGQRKGIPTKPDPTALLALAAELGVPPRETLYVGDSGVDMDAGRNAGMDTCGVLWGFRTQEELIAHGAKYLAGDPGRLMKIIEKQ